MAYTFTSGNRRPGHLVMITAFLRGAYASWRGIRHHRSPKHGDTGGVPYFISHAIYYNVLWSVDSYHSSVPDWFYRVDTLSHCIDRNFLASRY